MKNFFKSFKKPETIGLLLLLIVAGFFRFYQLGKTPPGIMVDEVAIGYNAYSIHKIGRDEWGIRYPLIFKSFGDYKPPGLEYTIAFLLNFLPLNKTTVRFPSAIAGFLSIVGIFFLVKEFFPKSKSLPFLGAAIFAFLPWSFQLSRLYFESNVALSFFIFGLVFLLRSIKNREKRKKLKILDKNVIGASILLALSGYFYVVYRIVGIAIFLSTFFLLYILKKISLRKGLLVCLMFFVFLLPILPQFFSSVGRQRLSQESGLIRFGHQLVADDKRARCYLATGKNVYLTKICYAFWNKPLLRGQDFIKSFLLHFSPDFLFINGSGEERITPSGYGGFFLFLFPFYLLGILDLFMKIFFSKKDANLRYKVFAIGLLMAPAPSCMVGSPVEQRTTLMIPFLIVIIILGIAFMLKICKSFLSRRVFFFVVSLLLLISTSKYLINYFWVYTKSNDFLWRNDIPLVMNYIQQHQENYDLVFFKDIYGKDAILNMAFYLEIDPEFFIQNIVHNKPTQDGSAYPRSLGKYSTNAHDLEFLMKSGKKILLVTRPVKHYSQFADYAIYSRDGVHRLAEIYDVEKLKKKIEDIDSEFNLE